MPIKIVSTSGHAPGTQILDADTGEDLTAKLMCEKVEIIVEAGQPNRATLTLVLVQLDVVAETGFDGLGKNETTTENGRVADSMALGHAADAMAYVSAGQADVYVTARLNALAAQDTAQAAAGTLPGLMVDNGYDGVRTR